VRYVEYEASRTVPNVVIDGSPNERTVLCLSHWPGIPDEAGLADDLSAQMAYRYVDAGMNRHGDAKVVTNNHFDQDGLVGVYAIVDPEAAQANRELLIDIAAAGDFATYRERRAARMAWVISAWGTATDAGDPFPEALERLPHLLGHLEDYRLLWEDEDGALAASEAAITAGTVRIDEEPELDLAVVRVDPDVGPWSGSRFAGQRFDGVHPMALHNATDMSGIALLHGSRFQYTHRYETWVQYVSRPRRGRIDLVQLAHRLTELDEVPWRADPAGALTPTLAHEGKSSATSDVFLGELREHLRSAPVAWDPRVGRGS
jgi:hypothetical protein